MDRVTNLERASTLIILAFNLAPIFKSSIFVSSGRWSPKHVAVRPPKNVNSIPFSNNFEILPLTKNPGFKCAAVNLKSESTRLDSSDAY